MAQEAQEAAELDILEPTDGSESPAETTPPEAEAPAATQEAAPPANSAGSGEEEEISSDLLERAREFDIDAEEARELGSKGLEKTLRVMERTLSRRGREAQQASQQQQQAPPQEKPKKFELKLNKELMDPDTAAAIEALHGHYEGVVSQLQGKIDAIEGQGRARAQQEFTERFDKKIEQLGDGYADVFGKGNGDKVSRREHKARVELLQEMDAIAAGYNATGRKPLSFDSLFERAVRQLHGDRAEAVVRRKVGNQLRSRSGQFISRPSHRATKQLTGEALAIANLTQRMRERNLLPSMGQDDLQNVPS